MVTQSTDDISVIPSNSLVLLDRPRINDLLSFALENPVTSIVAGSGYGKTMAVFSYLNKQDFATIWVHVSERDNEPTRFWRNYSRAIFRANIDLTKQMLELGFPYDGISYNKYADAISDAINFSRKYVIIIDDFHNIHDPDILNFFEHNLQAHIPNLHRVFISRENISIITASNLITDHFSHLNEDDLRFTREEIEQLFAINGLELPPDTIEKIYTETDGWVFALQLIDLFYKKNSGQIDYAVNAMKSNISKFIDKEIFSGISEMLQHYLLRMSLISHLYPDLLKRLENGVECLNELQKMTTFVRYDEYLGTYYIHQLFLDYLENKKELLSEQEKRDTYETAAKWYIEHGDFLEAINCYVEIGDYDQIVDIVFTEPKIIPPCNRTYLLNILRKAPPEILEKNETLIVVFARILISLGYVIEGEQYINSTIKRFKKLPESNQRNRVLFELHNNLGFIGLINCTYTGKYDFAKHFKLGDEYFKKCDMTAFNAIGSVNLSPYVSRISSPDAGESKKFIDAISRSIPYIAHSMNGYMSGLDDLARAEASFFQCNFIKCETYAYSALYKAREQGQYELENRALFFLLRTSMSSGKYEKVRSVLYQIESQPEMSDYATKYFMKDILTSWFYAQIGHHERMADWIKKDFDALEDPYITRGLEFLVKAKFYIAEKRYHRLLTILNNQYNERGIGELLYGKIEIEIMKANCLYHLKEYKAALQSFYKAYALSVPTGLYMFFVEMGNDMRVLSGYALKNKVNIPKEWLETIRKKSSTFAKRCTYLRSSFENDEKIKRDVTLSNKEMEVLSDLVQGLSRSEIATARNISINTVKTMLPIIFRKLEANSTIDAIRIAISRGIVK